MEHFAELLFTALIGAWIGSFIGSYLKKKGENLATHEDIDKLVEQVAAVTNTSKKIEAAIADDFWGKQRRWELHRDIMLAAVDQMANFQGTTSHLTAMTSVARRIQDPGKKAQIEEEIRSVARSLVEQTPQLMSMSYRIAIVAGPNLQGAFTRMQQILFLAHEKISDKNLEAATSLSTQVELMTHGVLAAIREELGFPSLAPTPQSSGSSGGPALAAQAQG